MTSGEALSRRSFLVGVSATGGGLALALAIPFGPAPAAEEAPEVTAWLLIGADNSVVIRVARAEMGQGAQTGLAMLVAEELECDWAKVRTEFVSAEDNIRRGRVWGDMSTGASRSIASSQLYLRQAGAIAREMLIAAAASRWNVPAAECIARTSAITHKPSGRSVTFGAVAEDAAKMAEVQFTGVEAVGFNGAVAVSREVAVTKKADGDGLSGSICERRSGVRWFTVMLDERDDVGALGQHQKPLLQPHEQVIGLPSLVLGFVILDFTNGKGVQLAVVAEKNSVTSVALLQGRHDAILRSITPISGKCLYQNFTKGVAKEKGQEVRIRRNPLP